METLAEAKAYVEERIEKGTRCPCCDRYVKVYKLKLNSAMARALLFFYRKMDLEEWTNVPVLLSSESAVGILRSVSWTKLAYWGLIEAKRDAVREDGSKRTGLYRITALGQSFARGDVRVPKYSFTFNDQVLTDRNDPATTSIRESLGSHFNYDELMRGV